MADPTNYTTNGEEIITEIEVSGKSTTCPELSEILSLQVTYGELKEDYKVEVYKNEHDDTYDCEILFQDYIIYFQWLEYPADSDGADYILIKSVNNLFEQ